MNDRTDTTDSSDTLADFLLDLSNANVRLSRHDDPSRYGHSLIWPTGRVLDSDVGRALTERSLVWRGALTALANGEPIAPDETVDGGLVWDAVLVYEDLLERARARGQRPLRGEPAELTACGTALQHERPHQYPYHVQHDTPRPWPMYEHDYIVPVRETRSTTPRVCEARRIAARVVSALSVSRLFSRCAQPWGGRP